MKEKEKKSKKGLKIFLIIFFVLLLAVGLFLLWWFNRKFDVTFKYNNGLEDYTVQVKYLKIIKDEDVKKDLTSKNSEFVGYYETYILSEADAKKAKDDEKYAEEVCKEGFKLDSTKEKCVAVDEFDFVNTKIKKVTTIEALWSAISFTINPTSKTIKEGETFKITATVKGTNNKTVKWSSQNTDIATVDDNGKVTGVKAGTATIIAESNGIRRKSIVTVVEPADEGTISLASSSSCVINTSEITLTATVSANAKNKNVSWSLPKCYTSETVSGTVIKLKRNASCDASEETTFTVTATLANGNKASVNVSYEPQLVAKAYFLYGGNPDRELNPIADGYYAGYYEANRIKTNIKATFKTDPSHALLSSTDTVATISNNSVVTMDIKTPCGQSKQMKFVAIIN